jgi:transposase-like protein
MPSGKQLIQQVLDRLPDDCYLEDIHYHIYVRQMIEEGRKEIREFTDYQ